MSTERMIEWRCECGAAGCDASVEMTFSVMRCSPLWMLQTIL